jgi:hypothetical protein
VKTDTVTFYSEGDQISALWRTPDEVDGPLRAIVQGPGWLGLKDAKLYERYHQAFTDAGFGVLVIDYRGFGDSGGPKNTLSPSAQLTDLLNAVTYVTTRDDVAADSIGAFGTGAAGGGRPEDHGGGQPGPGRRRRRLAAPDAQRARVAVLPRRARARPQAASADRRRAFRPPARGDHGADAGTAGDRGQGRRGRPHPGQCQPARRGRDPPTARSTRRPR